MKKNYGIELLRIVFMFMICMWHILGHGGIIESSIVVPNHHLIYGALVVICYCAVDGFALISGYVSSGKPRGFEKLVSIWFQLFFYSFIVTLILAMIGISHDMGIRDVLRYAFPITNVIFWYMTAYFILYLALPILDPFLLGLNEENSKKVLLLLVVLFSIIGFLTDPFETAAGYSALWLIVLYSIGFLAKKIHLFESKSSCFLILLWIISFIITYGTNICFGKDIFISYLSPTILLSAMIMVVLFSRMKFKGTTISKISPYVLGVYLFQLNPIVWHHLHHAFDLMILKPIGVGILYVLLYSSILMVIGVLVEWIRSKLAKWFHMEEISKTIVEMIQSFLQKCFLLLK